MILNQKSFDEFKQINNELLEKSFGKAKLALSFPITNSNSEDIKETIKNSYPDNTVLFILKYDDVCEAPFVLELNSAVLYNAANYYNSLARIVECIEKETKQISSQKVNKQWMPSYENLLKNIKSESNEEEFEEFHMKLKIPGITA